MADAAHQTLSPGLRLSAAESRHALRRRADFRRQRSDRPARARLTKRYPPAYPPRTLSTTAASRMRVWDLAMNKRRRRVHRHFLPPNQVVKRAKRADLLRLQ